MGVAPALAKGAIRVSTGPGHDRGRHRRIPVRLDEDQQPPRERARSREALRTERGQYRGMPAVQETIDQVKRIDVDQYKYGFETDIESVKAPKGLDESTVAFISEKKGEPGLDAGMAARGVPPLEDHDRADLGQGALPQDRLPGPLLLLGARNRPKAPRASPTSIPSCCAPTRSSASRCASARSWPASRAPPAAERLARRRRRRVRLASPSSPPSRTSWRRPASSSARSRRRCASIPSWCASIWARWCRSPTTSTPRSTRRCSPTARSSTCRRACAARWSCPPTSASTRSRPASSSARSSSPTRAPTCRYLEGCTAPMRDEHQLHAAVVELIALDDAEIKYSTVQNWYPGDKNGKGGIYNFVTKRGDCRGRNSKISWTQVETGSAITWKYPSCILRGDDSRGEFYSIAVSNGYQQVDSGTKMIHLGKNTSSRIISKGIAAGHSQNTYRGLVSAHRKATNARNFTNCDSLLIGDKCGAHTVPYIEAKNSHRALRARGHHVEDLRRQAVLLPAARPVGGGGGGADRQRLRARRAAAPAHGVHGRDAEADRHLAGRQRRAGSMTRLLVQAQDARLRRHARQLEGLGGDDRRRSAIILGSGLLRVRRWSPTRQVARTVGKSAAGWCSTRLWRRSSCSYAVQRQMDSGAGAGESRAGVLVKHEVGSQPGLGWGAKHSRIDGDVGCVMRRK